MTDVLKLFVFLYKGNKSVIKRLFSHRKPMVFARKTAVFDSKNAVFLDSSITHSIFNSFSRIPISYLGLHSLLRMEEAALPLPYQHGD